MKSVITMKRVWIAIMGVLMAGQSFAQDTTALSGTVTLDQCISLAIKNNLVVNQSRFVAESNGVYLMQARGNFLPFVSANINHNLSEGRVINSVNNTYVTQSATYASYNVNLNETIWNAGSIRNYVASSKYTNEAGKMDLQQQKDLISINVIVAYLQILTYEEQLVAANQQVESYKQQVDRSAKQNDLGALLYPSDLNNLKGNLAAAQLSVISAQKALESAKIALTQYLNVPYSKNFDVQKIDDSVTPVAYDVTSDVIYQQALGNLAIIKAGTYRRMSAEKSLKSAKGQLWPTLTFGANASSSFSSLATEPAGGKIAYPTQLSNNFGSSFGIGLSIPILNSFQNKGRVQLAKINLQQRKMEEVSNKTALQQNIEQAYVNVTSGYQSYQSYQDQVTNYTEAARIAQVRFNEGVTTAVEYLIAKTNADAAALSLISTKYDYVLRTKILDYYQGKLRFNQ